MDVGAQQSEVFVPLLIGEEGRVASVHAATMQGPQLAETRLNIVQDDPLYGQRAAIESLLHDTATRLKSVTDQEQRSLWLRMTGTNELPISEGNSYQGGVLIAARQARYGPADPVRIFITGGEDHSGRLQAGGLERKLAAIRDHLREEEEERPPSAPSLLFYPKASSLTEAAKQHLEALVCQGLQTHAIESFAELEAFRMWQIPLGSEGSVASKKNHPRRTHPILVGAVALVLLASATYLLVQPPRARIELRLLGEDGGHHLLAQLPVPVVSQQAPPSGLRFYVETKDSVWFHAYGVDQAGRVRQFFPPSGIPRTPLSADQSYFFPSQPERTWFSFVGDDGATVQAVYTAACRRRVAGLDLFAPGSDGAKTEFSGTDLRQRLHAWRSRLWGACRVREVTVEISRKTGTPVDARSL